MCSSLHSIWKILHRTEFSEPGTVVPVTIMRYAYVCLYSQPQAKIQVQYVNSAYFTEPIFDTQPETWPPPPKSRVPLHNSFRLWVHNRSEWGYRFPSLFGFIISTFISNYDCFNQTSFRIRLARLKMWSGLVGSTKSQPIDWSECHI